MECTILIILVVSFGLIVALAVIAVVAYDLVAMRRGWRTVSKEVLILGVQYPWFAVLVSGILGMVIGLLLGHLFLGQRVDTI